MTTDKYAKIARSWMIWPVACILYAIIGIFTFSYVYQRAVKSPRQASDIFEFMRITESFGAGCLWPVYWVGKVAFYITEPVTPEKQ